MRSESDSTGEQRGTQAPFRRGCPGGGESEQGSGGRANEGVDGVPEGVEVRDFVREEFQQIKCEGNSKNPWMRENLQSSGQMKYAEALEKPKRRDSGVKIEAGRKSGTQRETERFDGIHARPS